jgi:hypothetical protein
LQLVGSRRRAAAARRHVAILLTRISIPEYERAAARFFIEFSPRLKAFAGGNFCRTCPQNSGNV